MSLDHYRLPASVREGVELELPEAPGEKFRVRLPSRYNREFQTAQQRAVAMTFGDDFKPDLSRVDFFAWQEARHSAFLDHCVLEMPPGMTKEILAGDYRPALDALFELASELAEAEDDEAAATTKKNRKPSRLAS
jgi:hypothetical protein